MESSRKPLSLAEVQQPTQPDEMPPVLTTTTPTSDTHLMVGDTVEYDEPGFGEGIGEEQGLELTETMVQAAWRSVLYRHGALEHLLSKRSLGGSTIHYHRSGFDPSVIRVTEQ